MKKLNKATTIISKTGEILYWIAAAFAFVTAIISAFGKTEWLSDLSNLMPDKIGELESTGFSLEVINGDIFTKGAYIIFFITMFLVFGNLAMIFRNVNLILKTANGKTWFAKNESPFQPDNIRMVREIGIFFISIPIIETVMHIISKLVLPDNIDCSVDFSFIIVGIIVICLSEYFAYGMKLQNDVDGLL